MQEKNNRCVEELEEKVKEKISKNAESCKKSETDF